VLTLDDRELVHGEPVVLVGIVEVYEPDLVTNYRTVGLAVFDVHAVYKHSVERTVVRDKGRRIRAQDLAECLFVGFKGKVDVQTCDGISKTAFEDDILIASTLGEQLSLSHLRAELDHIAEGLEPGQRRLFDVGFRESNRHVPPEAPCSALSLIPHEDPGTCRVLTFQCPPASRCHAANSSKT
jgi:hypothetical protein